MKASSTELANRISRALISSASKNRTRYSWTPSLETLLHRQLGRDSLSPSLVTRVIDPHLLNHHSLALGFFNWASQQPSFSHDSTTYHSVLKSLSFSSSSRQNSTAAIEALLKRVRAQKITLEISIYRSVIASLITAKKTHNAYMVFRDVKDQILDIGPRICNSLLAALASDGYDGYAQKVFDEMRERNVALSTVGFGVYVMRLCGNVEVRVVLSVLDEVRKGGNSEINGSVIAVLIVHGLCEASRSEEALWVLDELRRRDCKPDFMAYRIVAEAIRATGDVVETDKVLKKKRKLGVAPRTSDYREFIFGLVSERRIREAKELGDVIVSGDFPIEDDVLNVLIGSVSAIDPGSAMVFFRFMVGKARYPTLLTLNNLCRNLIKHSGNGELMEVFQVLSSCEYFKDLETYNVMVSFLCKAAMVKEAYGVLSEMKKKGLRPDISTYNSLFEACCREDLLRPAKRLWDEMFADGCRGNLKTYNTLICKFSKVGQVDEALRLFYHMLSREVTPDVMTYTSLLEGLCQEVKLQIALEVFDKCVEQDLILAQTMLSTFILFLCKADHFYAASELLSGLSFAIAQSDSHVVLLKCLADAKEISIATEHIKWIRQASPAMWQTVSNELASISSSPIPELLQTFS